MRPVESVMRGNMRTGRRMTAKVESRVVCGWNSECVDGSSATGWVDVVVFVDVMVWL